MAAGRVEGGEGLGWLASFLFCMVGRRRVFQAEQIKLFGDYYYYFYCSSDPGMRTVLGGQIASTFTASFFLLEHATYLLAASRVAAGGQGHDFSWFRNQARTPLQRSG